MGSNYSKIKKAIEKGDEHKVLEIYKKNPELRKKLNANAIINDFTLDTYMHYAGKHGMLEFLKILINDNHGNPNKQNKRKQTVLHKVCEGSKDQVQFECLKFLLQWREPVLLNKNSSRNGGNLITEQNVEKSLRSTSNDLCDIDVNAKDDLENTPMHYAAMKNLATCVQSLVSHGAYLFVENIERSTPCDLAERYGHKDIALYLESKMIFSKDDEKDTEDDNEIAIVEEKQNYGLRLQDLQAEKDKLLIETAEMLHSSIYTAEILLKKHSWSKKSLISAWIEDPIKCCEKCGISSSVIEAIKNNKIQDNLSSSFEKKNPVTFNSIEDPLKVNKNEQITDFSTPDTTNLNFSLNESNKMKQIIELNLSSVIARKLSGRFMQLKKKEDSSSSFESSNDQVTVLNSNEKNLFYKTDDKNGINKNIHNKFTDQKSQFHSVNLNENIDLSQCGICFNSFSENNTESGNKNKDDYAEDIDQEDIVQILCGHKFCKSCCEQYFTIKIEEGNVIDIVCPQVDCFAIIPPEIVESLVSKETAKKYLQFDIKAFVDSNPTIKWCPSPGCGMAVRNPRLVADSVTYEITPIDYSQSVDCGVGHYFCWDCLQEGHEPASCQNWKDWYEKILEIKPEELHNTHENQANSANYLWLVTNSKKCPNPNCNAPIQKNEGCNHIKCYRCKLDFCWICLESWKKHSSATGGYFQCNRYEVSNKIIQKEKASIAEAEDAHLKAVELNKFVHYYTRFKNHEHSYKIEEPLLAMAKTKLEILTAQQNAIESNSPTRSEKIKDLNEIVHMGSEKRKSLTDYSNIIKDTINTSNNNSMKSAVRPFAKRISRSIEKGVSKLITSQDYNAIHDTSSSNNDVLESNCFSKKNELSHIENCNLLSCDHKNFNNENDFNQTDIPQKNLDTNDSTSPLTSEKKSDNNKKELHLFIEDAIRELLKARRILRCSYVYGYYLDTFGHQKFIFEFIQTEFEECTENLSQIIARPHLKTPKNKIIRLTNILKRKRIEFIETITRGLNSFNDTPPALKKYSRQRWKYLLKDNIQNDDEFKNTIALSLKELNPKNPWIIDKKGRHTNFLALLDDWPELENELDSILVPSKDKKGLCANWNCGNVRAVNTLSGSLCNYCSIKCMRIDHNNYLQQKKNLNKRQESEATISSMPVSSKTLQTNNVNKNELTKNFSNDPNKKAQSCYLKPKKSFLGIHDDSEKTSSFYVSEKSLKSADSDELEENDLRNSNFNNEVESKCLNPNETSELQNITALKNQNKDINLEFDIKKVFQVSQLEESIQKNTTSQLTHFGENTAIDDHLSVLPTTSKIVSQDTINNTQNHHKIVTAKMPYDSLFLNANENDISIIIKNTKNVLYDDANDTQNKISKFCNFPIKNK